MTGKKTYVTLGVVAIVAALFAVSCRAGASGKAAADKTITVGASPTPHAEILEQVVAPLKEQGYTLKVVVFNDYILPNMALSQKQLDANFFQHEPYLANFNAEKETNLVGVGAIHLEPIAAYSAKYRSLQDLPNGASIAVPNDPSNEARALNILAKAGLFTLRDGVELTATPQDIVANPKNIQIRELEAGIIPRALADVDAAVINGNYAFAAGKNPVTDSLALEDIHSPYANVIAVRAEDKDSPKIKALVNALRSDAVRTFINTKYQGAVIPAF